MPWRSRIIENHIEIGLEELSPGGLLPDPGRFGESAVEEIIIESLKNEPRFRRRQERGCPFYLAEPQKFAERKGQNQAIFVPSPEFSGDFRAQEGGVAARHDNGISSGVMERPDDSAP